MLRCGTNSLRVETGRWKDLWRRGFVIFAWQAKWKMKCIFCWTVVCMTCRERMYDDIFRTTGHKLDVRLMRNDRTG